MLSSFLGRVAVAKSLGDEWVETTAEVIRHFNPRGLGINPLTRKENRYFLYDGVKVCEAGQIDEIEEEINVPQAVRMHGDKEAIVEATSTPEGKIGSPKAEPGVS